MTFCRSLPRPILAVSALPLLLLAHGAVAQTGTAAAGAKRAAPTTQQPAAPAPSTANDMQVVTVVEQRVGANARIDRDTYDVKNNAATSNASAADVLNNVPAVSVDGDGKVSLRGSQNVRIMVDGKPAAQFQGSEGGANLNSLPAAALESVEVISTPGAEFGTEGGGGPILNLVMKRVQPAGVRGNLAANLGASGRYNANGYGSYSNGRISADTNFSVRHDQQEFDGESLRRRIQGNQTIATRSTAAGVRPNDSLMLSATLNYNLGDKEKLVATATLNRQKSRHQGIDHIVSIIEGQEGLYEQYDRATSNVFRNASRVAGAAYERKFGKPNEELRIDLRYSDNEIDSGNRFSSQYQVAPPRSADTRNYRSSSNPTRILDLTADYSLPLTRVSAMKAGMKVARLRGERDQDYFAFDPLNGEEVFDANRSSAFASTELTYALYASYDRWVNDNFMLRGGLRGEYTEQTMRYRQQQRAVETSNRYLMPNLAASYDFSKTSKLRFSASQRVERPRVEDLNPFLLYRDEFNSSQGDPRLTPQKTRNYELGWDHTIGTTRSNVRLTRMRSNPMFATALLPVAGSSTVISQRINFGYRQSDTLSFTLSHTIQPGWSVNGTLSLGHDEQSYLSNQRGSDGQTHSQELLRKGPRHQLQLSTNYRIDPRTTLSFFANRRGSQVTALGTSPSFGFSNLTVMHNLTDRLSLRLNVSDVFEWSQFGYRNQSGAVDDYYLTRNQGRIAYLGLAYRLGGVTGSAAVRNAGAARRPVAPDPGPAR